MAERILDGIRVLEWTVVWAGPHVANMLGEMGAEVIHVDHPRFLGVMGTYPPGNAARMAEALGMDNTDINPDIAASLQDAPWHGIHDMEFSALATNRKFIALDTVKDEGRKILYELVKISDICLNNLTTDVTHKLGLSYRDLRKANPRIINCAVPAFGEGPWNNYVGYGSTLECATGLVSMSGYGGDDAERSMQSTAGGFVVDPVAAMQETGAIISALIYRKQTGKGMNVEVSQFETGCHLINADLMDYTMNRRVRGPIGNNDRNVPFQGCYRSKGDDQWVVLSIRNQKEWVNLCCIIGKKDWLGDERFNNLSRAVENRREIDRAITAWAGERSKEDAARKLQNMNIPAAPVNSTTEVLFDPQVRHREIYKWVDYPYGPSAPTLCMPAKFSKTPFPEVYQPAKGIGADNYYVYGELLGLPKERIKELEARKIIMR